MRESAPNQPLRREVLRRQRARVIGASLCLIGHQSCEALVPVAIGITIDVAVASGRIELLGLCLAGLVLLFSVLTMCYRWFARLGEGAVIDESHAIRVRLARRMLAPNVTRRRNGELLTIASSDADQSTHSIIWVAGLFGAGAALVLSCAVLLNINLLLGLVLVGTAAVVTLGLNAISPLIAKRVTKQQETLASASALATDLITGLRVIHGLGAQRNAALRYQQASQDVERAGIQAGTAKSIQQGATVLASTIVLVVSVTYAGLLMADAAISLGAFVSAVGLAQFISEPLGSIGHYLQVGASAKASAARVAAVLHAPETDSKPAATVGPRIEVEPGLLLGIVTEPANVPAVISSFELPTGASLHVEPHRLDLFAGTIADNLALGAENAVPDPALAVDAAGATEFVAAQPLGMQQPVRDRGLSLSGGQRQRLTLARALHNDADVLVLEEPTTAVDSVTEEAIATGIRRLRHSAGASSSTVIFTRSPVLLAAADRVAYLRSGEPLLVGTHQELLSRPGYREMVLR